MRWLVLALACLSVQTIPIGWSGHSSGGGGGTQSLVQQPHNFSYNWTSAGTQAVPVTLTQNTASSNLLVVTAALYYASSTNDITFNAPTGEGTFAHCTVCVQTGTGGTSNEITDGWYLLSSSGGSGTITYNFSAPSGGCSGGCTADVKVFEYHKSSGAWALDTSAGTSNNSCSSCAFPSGTFGGSNDTIILWAATSEIPTALSAPWTSPSDVDGTNVYGAFFGAINQSSYTSPSISQAAAGYAAMAMMAFE